MAKIHLVYNRTGHLNRDGEALVQIEVYHYDILQQRARRKYISTGVYISPKHWKNNRVTGHPRSTQLNIKIRQKFEPVEDFIYKEDEKFTLKRLDEFISGKYRHSLSGFIESNSSNLSESKRKQHGTMLGHLTDYAGEVLFKDVDLEFIEGFDRYLRATKGFMDSTVYGYHKYLKLHLKKASKQKYLRDNPYDDFPLKVIKYETVRYLEPSELALIENYDLSRNQRLEKVRDFFVFCCYTGLSFQDATALQDDIVEVQGELMIKKPRIKTGEPFRIVLFPQAIKILKKYNNVLPVISHDKTNVYIKEVAFLAGVEKNITAHMARHTCAVLLLNNGVDLEIVSQWLGHSSPRITWAVYARVLDGTIIKQAKAAIKNINK